MSKQPQQQEERSSALLRRMVPPPNPKDSFPARLHQMLADIDLLSSKDASMRKLRDYVSWLDHGRSFKIHNKRQFESVVMPVWFNRLKCNSFLRQLSLYGFVRSHKMGAEKGAWSHENFQRDRPELAVHIERMDRCKRKSKDTTLVFPQNLGYQQHASPSVQGSQWPTSGCPSSNSGAQSSASSASSASSLLATCPIPTWIEETEHNQALKDLLSAPSATSGPPPPKQSKAIGTTTPAANSSFWHEHDNNLIESVLYAQDGHLRYAAGTKKESKLPAQKCGPTPDPFGIENHDLEPTPIAECVLPSFHQQQLQQDGHHFLDIEPLRVFQSGSNNPVPAANLRMDTSLSLDSNENLSSLFLF